MNEASANESPADASRRQCWPRLIWLVVGLALIVRVAWAWVQPTDPAALAALPDQVGYVELAENLLAGRGLTYHDPRFGQDVYAVRTPGYPLLVAASGADVRVVRLAQAGIDASTVLAVFLIARRLTRGGGTWGPLLAAGIVAVNPFLIYFSGLILTETLFTAMLAWGIYLLLLRRVWVLGTGILAVSVLVRPSAMGLPIVLSIAAVWLNRPTPNAYQPRRALLAGGLAVGLVGLVLAPWAIRNHRLFDRWILTTTNDGITRYDGFHPAASGASDQSFVERMPELKALDEVGRNDYLMRLSGEYIHENAGRVITLAGVKIARTWSPVPLSAQFSGNRLYWIVGLFYSVPFFALVLAGLWRGTMARSAKLLLLIPAAYITLVHAASVGSLRYRVPVEPPMSVLVAGLFCRRPADGRARDPKLSAC